MERRAFVRSVSMAMFGAAVASEGRAKALDFGRRSALEVPASEIDPHDEEFWSLVREQFPLTRDRAYFNTGGLGASPYRVIDAVKQKLDELEAVSETGRSQELWSTIKDKAAQMFGAEPSEIAFTRNATEGMNIVANGLPLRQGDEVVLTTHEHVGGTLCWLNRQRRDGIIVKTFEPDTARAEGNLEQIERVITSKTRAISISHVTCTTGRTSCERDLRIGTRQRAVGCIGWCSDYRRVSGQCQGLRLRCLRDEWTQMASWSQRYWSVVREQRHA